MSKKADVKCYHIDVSGWVNRQVVEAKSYEEALRLIGVKEEDVIFSTEITHEEYLQSWDAFFDRNEAIV